LYDKYLVMADSSRILRGTYASFLNFKLVLDVINTLYTKRTNSYLYDGEIVNLEGDLSDINLNNLTWWINKHNNYASREAIEVLLANEKIPESSCTLQLDSVAARKRWIKEVIYSKIPTGIRALLYFIYRYFLRFGFLDGSKGAVFHILQGFWYRFLVDQKVKEVQRLMRNDGAKLEDIVRKEFSIDINKLTDDSL